MCLYILTLHLILDYEDICNVLIQQNLHQNMKCGIL